MISKEELFSFVEGKNSIRTEPLNLPDWPEETHVRLLTGQDVDDYTKYLADLNMPTQKQSAYWIAVCLCGPDGTPIFSPEKDKHGNPEIPKEDIDRLLKLPRQVIVNTADRVTEVNALRGSSLDDEEGN